MLRDSDKISFFGEDSDYVLGQCTYCSLLLKYRTSHLKCPPCWYSTYTSFLLPKYSPSHINSPLLPKHPHAHAQFSKRLPFLIWFTKVLHFKKFLPKVPHSFICLTKFISISNSSSPKVQHLFQSSSPKYFLSNSQPPKVF